MMQGENNTGMVYKSILLNNLAVYWNSFSPAPSLSSKDELIEFLLCQVRENQISPFFGSKLIDE